METTENIPAWKVPGLRLHKAQEAIHEQKQETQANIAALRELQDNGAAEHEVEEQTVAMQAVHATLRELRLERNGIRREMRMTRHGRMLPLPAPHWSSRPIARPPIHELLGRKHI